MSGPEERERAVGLYFTTPMTTAQVGEAPGLSDQAVLGTPVGEGSPVCRSYGGTHHPAGDKGQGDRNRCRAACVCSIESGPCERVESLQMSGRF